jgi:uncharacterized protein
MTTDEREAVLTRTVEFVRGRLEGEGSGHDWWHVHRVWRNAVRIGATEDADPFVVQLAALLHDIADWKFNDGDDSVGPRVAAEWLESCGVAPAVVRHVARIIGEVSFKGAGVPSVPSTIEGKIVQDADRLDAIGAIGIARTFAYGGSRGRPIYDPAIPPVTHRTFEEYKRDDGPTINHFHAKLLLLRDRMNTESARKLANERHAFMEAFLREFLAEWEGDR